MRKKFLNEYNSKVISGQEATSLIKSGNHIHMGGSANIAAIIDKYLAQRVDELEDIKVNTYLDTVNYKICEADPEGKIFQWVSGFLLGPVRGLSKKGGRVFIRQKHGTRLQ